MINIERFLQKINRAIERKDNFYALEMFLTLSPVEKEKVDEAFKEKFDIDLSLELPIALKTVGDIRLYQMNTYITPLSTSALGNNYLKKIFNIKKIKILIKEMIDKYDEELEDAKLLRNAEKILKNIEYDYVDFEEIQYFIKDLKDDKNCEKKMEKLIEELKSVFDSNNNDNFNLADILFYDRFKPFSTLNNNLITVNLELSKINKLGFFIAQSIDENDFIIIKLYSYSDIENLFFIGVNKFKDNIFCPICKNKEKFSQYIDINTKLVTICNQCSNTINL